MCQEAVIDFPSLFHDGCLCDDEKILRETYDDLEE
jgi:hypothetical protein